VGVFFQRFPQRQSTGPALRNQGGPVGFLGYRHASPVIQRHHATADAHLVHRARPLPRMRPRTRPRVERMQEERERILAALDEQVTEPIRVVVDGVRTR
jgi:hypothetical protein